MQLDSVSNQSFGQLHISREAYMRIAGRASKVELDALDRLMLKEAKNPVDVFIYANKEDKNSLVGIVGNIGTIIPIVRSEAKHSTPYSFIDKLCRLARLIDEKKYDMEDLRRFV